MSDDGLMNDNKGFTMKALFKSSLTIIGIIGFATTVKAASNTPVGYWRTEEGKAKVQVYECGTKQICGKIIELKEPKDPHTKKDKTDPDGKPMIGMEIMKNFKHNEDQKWDDGTIYDPKEGKTYSATFELQKGGNAMALRGYILIILIGKTQTWTRTTETDPLK
jgi:uncharacterized protein (DUF2147 family)